MTTTIRAQLREHYQALLTDPDPQQRELALLCLQDLEPAAAATLADRGEPGDAAVPWAHVLPELVEAAGNVLVDRGAELKTGHQPLHGSASGTCLSINRARGVWWCSSCQQGGGAIGWVIDTQQWSYTSACAWLRTRYGAPTP